MITVTAWQCETPAQARSRHQLSGVEWSAGQVQTGAGGTPESSLFWHCPVTTAGLTVDQEGPGEHRTTFFITQPPPPPPAQNSREEQPAQHLGETRRKVVGILIPPTDTENELALP